MDTPDPRHQTPSMYGIARSVRTSDNRIPSSAAKFFSSKTADVPGQNMTDGSDWEYKFHLSGQKNNGA